MRGGKAIVRGVRAAAGPQPLGPRPLGDLGPVTQPFRTFCSRKSAWQSLPLHSAIVRTERENRGEAHTSKRVPFVCRLLLVLIVIGLVVMVIFSYFFK